MKVTIKPSGIDWADVDLRENLRTMLKKRFEDEDDDFSVLDYFSPPEEGDTATCDYCQHEIFAGDWEGMADHLLKDHLEKLVEDLAK